MSISTVSAFFAVDRNLTCKGQSAFPHAVRLNLNVLVLMPQSCHRIRVTLCREEFPSIWVQICTAILVASLPCIVPPIANGQNSISRVETVKATAAIEVGECRISTYNQVALAAETAGVLDAIIGRGTAVRAGQVVAQIRDSIARASFSVAQKQAENDVEIRFAKKAAELAQLKYEQAQKADRTLSGTVTEFELSELRLAAEQALLRMQQAQQQLAIAQLKKDEIHERLKSYQVTAPFDGFARIVNKKPGEFVREGETVVELVNDNVMLAEGFVDYKQAAAIAIGSNVEVYLRRDGVQPEVFRGRINFVDNKLEPISMQIKVSALVNNKTSALKDGFLVTMAILPTGTRSGSLR